MSLWDNQEFVDLLAKIDSLVSVYKVPKLLVDWYVQEGGEATELDRLAQIVACSIVDEITGEMDFWGPFDQLIRDEIRQRAVDYVHTKFLALTSGEPTHE